MRTFIKKILKKSFWLCCVYYLITDLLAKLRYYKGNIDTDSGSIHTDMLSIDSSLAYIEEVFNDYKYYSGVQRFKGRVAEVGPGDNCGVGMLFLADGCESVDLVDRFYSNRNSQQQALIYQALIERHPQSLAKFCDFDINDETSFKGLQRYYGETASAEQFFTQTNYYDFIVSRAVLEHIYDPRLAIEKMVAALKNDGMLLHKVDLRNHGLFSDLHELSFFEVPDWLYPWLTKASDAPNRILINTYRQILAKTIPDYKIFITRLAGVGDIDPHLPYEQINSALRNKSLDYVKSVRSKFSKSLRSISDEDLLVAGIFIVAHKSCA
jgi:SAM-dependent methyltransferase